MIEMTNEEWSAKYRPVKNHLAKDDTTVFGTHGEELLFVSDQPNSNVWTEMDLDEGVYIRAGYYERNRLAYYVTDVPWDSGEEVYVTICTFEICACYDEEIDSANPDCELCYGDGNYTDWK
jgi:hypothetical protein